MEKSDVNILLLAGSADLNLKVLYCLYPAFKNIHVIANAENSILKYSRYKKKFEYIPWSRSADDQHEVIETLMQYCVENEIDMVLPGDIDASAFIYKYKKSFSDQKIFPVMGDENLEKIDNKWTFADILMKEGLSTPTTMLIDSENVVDEQKEAGITEKIGFPLIVKPLFCESSHGVVKIETFTDLREHVLGDKPYSDLPLIIQSYIDGYDIDSSFIADNGKVMSLAVQKWNDGDVLEFRSHREIEEISEKIIRLFNYSGAGHFDMRIDFNTGIVYVIECNPRFWYTITAAMWQGLNFVESAVNYTMGRDYKKTGAVGNYRLPGSMIRMLLKKPWRYFSLAKNERGGLWQPILDPLPHLVGYFRK